MQWLAITSIHTKREYESEKDAWHAYFCASARKTLAGKRYTHVYNVTEMTKQIVHALQTAMGWI